MKEEIAELDFPSFFVQQNCLFDSSQNVADSNSTKMDFYVSLILRESNLFVLNIVVGLVSKRS